MLNDTRYPCIEIIKHKNIYLTQRKKTAKINGMEGQ